MPGGFNLSQFGLPSSHSAESKGLRSISSGSASNSAVWGFRAPPQGEAGNWQRSGPLLFALSFLGLVEITNQWEKHRQAIYSVLAVARVSQGHLHLEETERQAEGWENLIVEKKGKFQVCLTEAVDTKLVARLTRHGSYMIGWASQVVLVAKNFYLPMQEV